MVELFEFTIIVIAPFIINLVELFELHKNHVTLGKSVFLGEIKSASYLYIYISYELKDSTIFYKDNTVSNVFNSYHCYKFITSWLKDNKAQALSFVLLYLYYRINKQRSVMLN